jgi:hypothetical protein
MAAPARPRCRRRSPMRCRPGCSTRPSRFTRGSPRLTAWSSASRTTCSIAAPRCSADLLPPGSVHRRGRAQPRRRSRAEPRVCPATALCAMRPAQPAPSADHGGDQRECGRRNTRTSIAMCSPSGGMCLPHRGRSWMCSQAARKTATPRRSRRRARTAPTRSRGGSSTTPRAARYRRSSPARPRSAPRRTARPGRTTR